MLKKMWYFSVKQYLKVVLNFYAKGIKIKGLKNIPKNEAVLFAANHPNALIDPLFIAAFNTRMLHFLVRADVFKKPLIRKALATLNLMPIYRIRDGRRQLKNNEEIFNKCYKILSKKEALLIFPQGGHSRERTIKPLSKGFTRIIFGALSKNPDLKIWVIPVGLTYQNQSTYPCKVAVNFGEKIDANHIYNSLSENDAITKIKKEVSEQLQKLSVHIPNDENFVQQLTRLNKAQVDFTEVDKVNRFIKEDKFPEPKPKATNYLKPLFYVIVVNSLLPYLFWKKQQIKIKEQEFVDTFRLALNMITFPLNYLLQGLIISNFTNSKVSLFYFICSLMSVFFYTKLAPNPTED